MIDRDDVAGLKRYRKYHYIFMMRLILKSQLLELFSKFVSKFDL